MLSKHHRLAWIPLLGLPGVAPVLAADRDYTFGYDQPHTTGSGVAGDVFAAKLAGLSHGSMMVDQFSGTQLGQEPQMLRELGTGDIATDDLDREPRIPRQPEWPFRDGKGRSRLMLSQTSRRQTSGGR